MILKKEEYMEKINAFVDAYLIQKELMEGKDADDKTLTAAVIEYMSASQELLEFVFEFYEEDDPELPRMDVFFSENKYNDFAYRIYKAVSESEQIHPSAEWRNFTMVYIGELLRNRFGKGQAYLEGGKWNEQSNIDGKTDT